VSEWDSAFETRLETATDQGPAWQCQKMRCDAAEQIDAEANRHSQYTSTPFDQGLQIDYIPITQTLHNRSNAGIQQEPDNSAAVFRHEVSQPSDLHHCVAL
jgi:hypothetical protein